MYLASGRHFARKPDEENYLVGNAIMMRTEVYDQLKERLFAGDLRAGQFVSQRELASLLGATLNPVREAIRKLEAEGLINVYAQRGIQIIEGAPKAINDAYEFRALVELDAVKHFSKNATDKEISKLQDAIQSSKHRLEQFPDNLDVRFGVLDDDYNFHKYLVGYKRNDMISRLYSVNAARLRLFRVNIGEPLQRLDVAASEHLEILEACAARDPEVAADRLARHIEISREHTLGIRPMRQIRDVE
jgi:DNA-binding GntR family transcriptional regulator